MGWNSKKKRRLANSVFSLMLVLVMVISNVQVSPGMLSTVLAAESSEGLSSENTGNEEAIEDKESAENRDKSEDNGLEETAEIDKSSETESTEPDEGENSQEATKTDEDEKVEGTPETDEDEQTEVTEAVETKIVEEENTEESDELLNEGEGDDSDNDTNGEQVTITIHFKNSNNWSQVAAFYGNRYENVNDWELLCDKKSWPGDIVEADKDGYYTIVATKPADSDLAIIFNNNDTINEAKTKDIIIGSEYFKGFETYEFWVWMDGSNTVTLTNPEVKGSTVVFRYKNSDASKVHVLGTHNDWDDADDEYLLNKDDQTGMHSRSVELSHGLYQYKYNGTNADWVVDPENPFTITEANGNTNSVVYVPGEDIYTYTIHYYNPNGTEDQTPDLHLWDKSLGDDAWKYPAANKDRVFDTYETDAVGRKWWTVTLKIPYQNLGFIGRANAGSYTSGEDDSDREYEIKTDNNEVELWYVHGDGVYEENPYVAAAGLNAPKLTIGKIPTADETVFTLPAKLTKGDEDGNSEEVDVTYTMTKVTGVTLDDGNKKITLDKAFTGSSIELTATETDGTATVTFEIRVVEDKNEITVKLHYSRTDGNYENWNLWVWSEGTDGLSGERCDFKEEDGEMVATIILNGRSNSSLGYIVRKSIEGNEWAEKDPNKELNRYIDLSTILSGTVDCYVQSGEDEDKEEPRDDILTGVKICSAEYDKETNSIKITTGMPIEEDFTKAFVVKDASDNKIAIREVTTNNKEYTLVLEDSLSDIEARLKTYYISFGGYDYKLAMEAAGVVYSSAEFEEAFTYTGSDLGAAWTAEKTTFKVWAPIADKVQVKLYDNGENGKGNLTDTIDMIKGEKGVWTAAKEGDLNGTYYTYSTTIGDTTTEACDPYARTTGVNGDRAMVLDLDSTDPEGWAEDVSPNQGMSYTDSVIYELHVRDFSIDESSGISADHKGKFLGLTEKGTTNATGQTTGLDYLTDLGVTHIHLLPSYDYATVDETDLGTPQYNWGYDPKNYNVPEGSYSTNPYAGEVRVKEMKQMVKTLHDNNINVIMDVVYNHVYDADKFCFNQIVPQYFSRTKEDGTYSNGSGCGNDTASERAMVKKYIVDSVNYWADEYHIDGFRFDLVGLLDTETINEVVETVHAKHPNVVFYGEGWTMNTEMSKDGYTMATQTNASETPQFAYFSDTIRDLLKGGNNETDLGFVSGLTGQEEPMANCFRALAKWSSTPTQIVNYASCHDNYTLKDKLDITAGKANTPEDVIKMNNLAAAIYLTAEGIPLIHAGEEILREKKDENGNVDHNSYKSPDSINSIKWSNLDKEEYRQTRDYYKGLIEFRKNHAALRLTTAEEVKANVQYKWITNEVIMFVINGKEQVAGEISDGIVIIFNATRDEKNVDLYLEGYGIAEGTWNVCINGEKAGIKVLDTVTDGKVTVAPISAMVLVKGETEGDSENELLQKKLQELKNLINENKDLQQGNYTDDSWAAFQTALNEATVISEKESVTVDEIDAAISNLQDARSGLHVQEGKVDFEQLRVLVKQYKGITQDNYSDDSWAAFQTALNTAEALLDTDATQKEVDDAKAALEKAYSELKKNEGGGTTDKQKLENLINEYGRLTEQGNYTDDSWKAFQDALEAAKGILAKVDATQDEVDKAVSDLQAAYDNLRGPEGVVITGKLEALIKICKEIEVQGQKNYTDDSWAAFATALTEAEKALAASDATQDTIDSAEKNLRAAYDGLAEKPTPGPDEEYKDGLWTKWADDSGLTLGSDKKYHTPYTGKALKPAILVYDGRTLLKEKTDYTITYQNNINAGDATVTIKGKGNYNESHVENFIIDAIDINTLDIADLYTAVASNNTKQIAPKPVVKFNGKTLKLNKDYTAEYEHPDTDGKSLDGKDQASFKVFVKAKSSNFKGSKPIQMTLVDKNSVYLMSKAKIGKIAKEDMVYSGAMLKPILTVKYGNNTLNEQTKADDPNSGDYTVIYDAEHTGAGETATITVRGNGTTYVGEKTISFKITGTALKAGDITLENAAGITYTGTEQKPVVAIKNMDTKDVERCTTVRYQNNTNVGTATVVITGRNGYTGTVKKTFKIAAYDISVREDNKFTYNQNADGSMSSIVTYAKGGSKFTDEQVGASFLVTAESSVRLEQGKDFTLSYKNNKKVGEKTASVTIKGKGNFKGTIKDIPFTIEARSLKDLEEDALAGDILKKNAKKYNKVIPVITDQDGKALKNKTDFVIDVESAYTYEDGSAITETPNVGDVIRVTAKAKQGGNYTGELSATFRVIDDNMSLAKATVKVAPQQYTGAEVKPGKDQITVEMKINGSKETLKDGDYKIIDYSNNIKKGTAKITIRGNAPYGGTKTVKFKINAQPMK